MTPAKSILFSHIFIPSVCTIRHTQPEHFLPKRTSRGSVVPRQREQIQNRAVPSSFCFIKSTFVISDILLFQHTPACLLNIHPDGAAAPFRSRLLLSRPQPDPHISCTTSAAGQTGRTG